MNSPIQQKELCRYFITEDKDESNFLQTSADHEKD